VWERADGTQFGSCGRAAVMADSAAINLVSALVQAAMYIAKTISDAIDEANTLAELLPLVQAGLEVIRSALRASPAPARCGPP